MLLMLLINKRVLKAVGDNALTMYTVCPVSSINVVVATVATHLIQGGWHGGSVVG